MSSVVIIGAGHAGVQVAVSLREMGFEGKIQLIADEPHLPYQKPPLSKGFLNGKQTVENLLFRNEKFYDDNQIELLLGEEIVAIDVENKIVKAESDKSIPYDTLVLATGARNRKLSIETKCEVLYLRDLTDAQRLKSALENAQNIAIIGGGFIGLEVAASAAEAGKNVTVIEAQDRLMARVLPPVLSEIFLTRHQEMGVKVLLNTKLSSDELSAFDLIVVGIGVLPNQELAAAAGLECHNGILVNEYQMTSNSVIYAIGDCANHFNVFADKRCRLESVQNAVDQAKIVASHILGNAIPYHAVPWFWTNQYDLKLQMAGINTDYDNYAFRGDLGANKFSIFYYKNEKIVAADSLNRPADHLAARKLLQAGATLSKEQVQDINFKLTDVLN